MGWPCLLTDQDEMSNLYRRPSIDASYQVSVHLAKGFQRRIKCEKFKKKISSRSLFKRKFGCGVLFLFHFSEWLKTKSISFILSIFTLLEPQNINWTTFQKSFI
jgi:hypothetical protein